MKTTRELLEEYTIENASMKVSYFQDLEDDNAPLAIEKREQLRAYMPGLGDSYRVSCRVRGSGENLYLAIELPNPEDENAWGEANSNRRKLIDPLKFVTAPNHELPEGRQGVLYLDKGYINSEENRLGSTQWKIVHCRIQKYMLPGKDSHGRKTFQEVNDVIFQWDHPDSNRHFITCWKW